ncbi:hypothetical protein Cylst_4249 [Cylindrospermum stagnale PCC 7417]|uniref:Uncharacterized protein n=1 Tax=Cylindrospermum stagnale PCC 7417 TaxID=56107 RepID=K9X3S1_9NOST|nr:hypothetical protein Cylst_4249 [Cylindrospermum stagnale PCC 7417]
MKQPCLKKGKTGVEAPFKKAGTRVKVPLFKGDLGGSRYDLILYEHPLINVTLLTLPPATAN